MTTNLVSARGIGKQYFIGAHPLGTLSLRDRLTDAVRSAIRRERRNRPQDFWALRDVDFDLARGEVLGVIGRNGAGKSTLLKIISQITDPTEGEAHLFGRVASLLEVGVGFHPELSGRENVFLNGAILGMTRAEIRRKFDEIVAFAEVEKFIDTPVKRYSSGMYVRLAFAVAAHLEPDVLIVDEVLAVGDIAFQRKCLGKMETIASEQRAVMVVSHNMSIVSQLCEKVIWLDKGRVVRAGSTREVIGAYLAQGSSATDSWSPPPRAGAALQLHGVSIGRESGATGDLAGDEAFDVIFDYSVNGAIAPGRFALLVSTSEATVVFASASTDETSALRAPWRPGRHRATCRIPGNLLAPGTHFITISEPLEDGGDAVHEGVLEVTVSEQNSIAARDGRSGVIAPLLQWSEVDLT
ncbi:MAG TPA: polysaccharide ABC transporter ATP-binding protein [Thermoanaerobaculia bacterium]|jgi:lipopolysaccharide transport system ATP-binding protein|nr:polysaccharide ABC transporter ATP-binding protein [Thermoanaerobaculia bacterium]